MYLVVGRTTGDPIVTVAEPDDCTRLHVQAPEGLSASDADGVLRGAGLTGGPPADGEQLWLDVAALRTAALRAVTPGETAEPVGDGWAGRFDTMLAYATSKGWCDADGRYVAAHIERETA